jgi:ParE toxin of type II toxin-antitoxin system, parDE
MVGLPCDQRHDLARGLRMFAVGDYVVLYRSDGDDVVIVRVVRGNRDLEPLFDEDWRGSGSDRRACVPSVVPPR